MKETLIKRTTYLDFYFRLSYLHTNIDELSKKLNIDVNEINMALHQMFIQRLEGKYFTNEIVQVISRELCIPIEYLAKGETDLLEKDFIKYRALCYQIMGGPRTN